MNWGSQGLHPITIVTYHAIEPEPGPYVVTPEAFAGQIEFIKNNYPILRLGELRGLFAKAPVGRRGVVLTFDDAYTSFLDFAFPLLREFAVPCTLSVPTGFIGGYNEWDLASTLYPRRKLMTAAQLRSVFTSGLVDIASHGVHHVRMNAVPVQEMRREAVNSKETLEHLLATPIKMFAYPFGSFSSVTTQVLVEAGYDVAVTSHWGTRNGRKNIMTLRRISFLDSDHEEFLRSKIEKDRDRIGLKERFHVLSRKAKMLLVKFST